jgi:hypothetical protein
LHIIRALQAEKLDNALMTTYPYYKSSAQGEL